MRDKGYEIKKSHIVKMNAFYNKLVKENNEVKPSTKNKTSK